MSRDIITGYTVNPDAPMLFASISMIEIPIGTTLNFDLSTERWCVGYDEPPRGSDDQAPRRGPCPDGAPARVGGRCEACEKRTRIQPCISCVGLSCNNPARRSSCVFSDHFVYLACFAPEVFKVGITRSERFRNRITEQGAYGAIAIAAAGGQEVRRIEYLIARAGWPDRINVMKVLDLPHVEPADAEGWLRDETKRIAYRMPDLGLNHSGPFVYVGDSFPEQMRIAPRLLNPSHDALSGVVVGMRGGYLLLEAEGETVAVGLRSLIGRELTPRNAPVVGPAQGMLAV